MLVGMVDDRAMRFRGQTAPPPRPRPAPVLPPAAQRPEPTTPNFLNSLVSNQVNRYGNLGKAVAGTALGALDVPVQAIGGMHRDVITGGQTGGQSAGSRALQNYGQQVGGLWSDLFKPGAGQTPLFQPREFDAAGEAAVDRFGLEGVGAGAVQGGAAALDLLTGLMAGGVGGAGVQGVQAADDVLKGAGALKDIGVTGANRFVMSAADPMGAQAARGLTEADLMQNPQGLYAAILRNLARHRSKNPYLSFGVKNPEDVPMLTGRAGGPGTYFGQSQQASDDAYSSFGENVYRIREPFTEVWNTVRNSPGYVTDADLFNRYSFSDGVDVGQRVFSNGTRETPNISSGTEFDSPLIQDLIDAGYKGYKYANNAFTDWTVGANPLVGLSRVSGPKLSQELVNDFRNKARYELQDPNNPVNKFLINPINDARSGISNAIRQPIKKINDARSASEDAYQRALIDYNTAEGLKLAQMFGPAYGGRAIAAPNLRPPAPPGYVAGTAPKQPGPLDFLQYLFNQ